MKRSTKNSFVRSLETRSAGWVLYTTIHVHEDDNEEAILLLFFLLLSYDKYQYREINGQNIPFG